MNRREVFGMAIGGASLAIASNKVLADEHGDHATHMGLQKLSAAARNCVSSGDACVSHCLGLMAAGDDSVSACAKSAYQMVAMCEAVARLAAANSTHLPQLAKLAHITCLDCEAECRKHENEHAVCKTCAESCAACAEECKNYSA
ncbi:MAG: four-helix bundle copper-binding protein [Rhodomicrobium sp.]